MPSTLASLSPEAVGLIFDWVDARSLLRAVFAGSTVLNNKIFGCVSRFEHYFGSTVRRARAKWPKILSSFVSLEHVSICSNAATAGAESACIYEVDLLALPEALRTLELKFYNSLLCVVELPPLTYSEGDAFTPRLRSDLRHRFKKLERLTFEHSIHDWDLSKLAEDLASWPLFIEDWGLPLPRIPLARTSHLSDGVLSLAIQVSDKHAQQEKVPTLPPSLLFLKLSKAGPFPGAPTLLRHRPTADQLWFQKPELALLAQLKHLTSLDFPTKTIDTELLSLLPHTLLLLTLQSADAELESFAHFPTELTRLTCKFQSIFSSTTSKRLALSEFGDTGLPDDFLPSMRDVVEKLPKRLQHLPDHIWRIIRPKDWDAFPSRQARTSAVSPVTLSLAHAPYLSHLPPKIGHVYLTCTFPSLAYISALNPLVSLHLPLRVVGEHGMRVDSDEELEAAILRITSILEVLARWTTTLKVLHLDIDGKFDLAFLHHLGSALKLNELYFQAFEEPDRDDIESSKSRSRAQLEQNPPQCLASVKHLLIDDFAWNILQPDVPCIFKACGALEELLLPEWTPVQLPADWISLLPPTLEYCSFSLVTLDSDVFKALPRSLRTIIVRSSDHNNWDLPDFLFLPRCLRFISLPPPRGETLPRENAVALLRELANEFDEDVEMVIGDATAPSHKPSLKALLVTEFYNRKASGCTVLH